MARPSFQGRLPFYTSDTLRLFLAHDQTLLLFLGGSKGEKHSQRHRSGTLRVVHVMYILLPLKFCTRAPSPYLKAQYFTPLISLSLFLFIYYYYRYLTAPCSRSALRSLLARVYPCNFRWTIHYAAVGWFAIHKIAYIRNGIGTFT